MTLQFRFSVHAQLLNDCHLIGRFERCRLLLHKDAALPWFILVPETDKTDLLALDSIVLGEIMGECRLVNRFLVEHLQYKKTNFAAIGNVVPQLHLHVVGRREDDPCWPAPVWGNLNSGEMYSPARIETYTSVLHDRFDMRYNSAG